MKEIYIIRHGETELNRLGIVQGSGIDSDLNERGFQQAAAFFRHYEHEGFDLVLSSKLRRTYQTIRAFVEEKGLLHESFAEINEISWGDNEGKVSTPETNEEYTNIVQNWANGNYEARFKGGESAAELAKRVRTFFEHLAKRKEKKILICTHGRTTRCIIALLKYNDLSSMEIVEHTNVGLYKLIYKDDKYSVEIENSKIHLLSIT